MTARSFPLNWKIANIKNKVGKKATWCWHPGQLHWNNWSVRWSQMAPKFTQAALLEENFFLSISYVFFRFGTFSASASLNELIVNRLNLLKVKNE